MQSTIPDTEVTAIDGEVTSLQPYSGSVLLIINVASKCGLMLQCEQLENLQKAWHQQGFSVLSLPCSQFLGQEPGSEEEIKTYYSTARDVTFPMFSKIDVNGEGRHPLYQELIDTVPVAVTSVDSGFCERMTSEGHTLLYPGDILWNSRKSLVGRDGKVLQRFSPDMAPENPILMQTIRQALTN